MLISTSKIRQDKKSNSQYLTIPAAITLDSEYKFQEGDEVNVRYDKNTKELIITSTGSKRSKSV